MTPLRQLGRHYGVDLRALAGEHQQLLGIAPQRLVEQAFDLFRIANVRLVRGEGAVLAVALAGPREGERVVPREGDAPHVAQATATKDRAGNAGPVSSPSNRRPEDPRPQRAPSEYFSTGGRTGSAGSVGGRPPFSITKRKTAAASSEPTIGPTT